MTASIWENSGREMKLKVLDWKDKKKQANYFEINSISTVLN